MKHSASISIFFSLILANIYLATASNGESTTTLIAQAKPNDCVLVGRIAKIEGVGLLKREAWNQFKPTDQGTELCLGDRLTASLGATITIQCTDHSQPTWSISNGETSGVAKGCPKPEKPRFRIDGPIRDMRQTPGRIPYIISRGSLLSDKPKLRWIAVEGSNSYNVRITGSGVNWPIDVSTTEVVYDGQPLKPGVEYLLKVTADKGDKEAKNVFFLLDKNKAQSLEEAQLAIAKQNLPDEAKALALADLYIGEELFADTIELLEPLAAKESQTSAVYQTLGYIYTKLELFSQAEKYYSKALELATTAKDIEGQAVAAERLGEVFRAQGKVDSAIASLKKARTGYQELGDMQRVRDLEERLTKIEKTQTP